ncbi:MAG: NADH-quinone oxidoreductase subunit NuoF [Candidatus Schekmanbacteria bacterium]|nr:NADH-quinone oxidoreductase subunit NuoF [Candidatus Schekmanbacteria bacterium]
MEHTLPQTRVLLKNIGTPDSETLDGYLKNGGYQALKKAVSDLTPEEIVDSVKRSGLRGRGGAGFPAGMKWQFCASDQACPKYVICNADEGEPGTFKDRILLEEDPHAVLEGMALAGYAIGANQGYVYIRGEYYKGALSLEKAVTEANQHHYLGQKIYGTDFDFNIQVFRGAGAYICGEETALLDSLEGKAGRSRIKPPYPVNQGLWGKPTCVNNVETLTNIPWVVNKGVDWYRKFGTEESPGTKIYSLSGHVNHPGNYELPMGATLRELIYEYGGGIRQGRRLKAVMPGGASSACLTEKSLDVKMDFHSLAAAGSMLGSGAVIVMDENTCMVGAAHNVAAFFEHESCGRCTPCREGTHWIKRILERVKNFEAKSVAEIDLIADLGQNMRLGAFCPLGMGAPSAALSIIQHFRDEFETHVKEKRCPVNIPAVVPGL